VIEHGHDVIQHWPNVAAPVETIGEHPLTWTGVDSPPAATGADPFPPAEP
jgi:hypothetical protein